MQEAAKTALVSYYRQIAKIWKLKHVLTEEFITYILEKGNRIPSFPDVSAIDMKSSILSEFYSVFPICEEHYDASHMFSLLSAVAKLQKSVVEESSIKLITDNFVKVKPFFYRDLFRSTFEFERFITKTLHKMMLMRDEE